MQGHVDIAVKDKRQALNYLDSLRKKMRDTLKDKSDVLKNFNLI
jgi:hypothetical protein